VAVRPGDNLQRLVDANPDGTTFCLEPRTYRMFQVKRKDRQRFIGAGRRTVLSGARILEAADAIRDGDRWYWTGQTQSSEPHRELLGAEHGDSNPGDAYNEELISTPSGEVGDTPFRLRRVTSAG
jgi:hypothetical protein